MVNSRIEHGILGIVLLNPITKHLKRYGLKFSDGRKTVRELSGILGLSLNDAITELQELHNRCSQSFRKYTPCDVMQRDFLCCTIRLLVLAGTQIHASRYA